MSRAQKYANMVAVDGKFIYRHIFVLSVYDESIFVFHEEGFKYLRHVNMANDKKNQVYFYVFSK